MRHRVQSYLQLLRLPNVFTAMADILLGFLFTHDGLNPWPLFALLLGASSSLYLAGMVLNDVFDVEQDARERPFRPIPSGRVTRATAARLGIGLLALGVALVWLATFLSGDPRPGAVGILLALSVLLYDGLLKRTPVGPIAMGSCRALNVLLGMSLANGAWSAAHVVVAGGIGVYVVGVTIFARSEAASSGRVQLLIGVIVMVVGIAFVASLPASVTGQELPPIEVPERWYVLWGFVALLIAGRCLRAILDARPDRVQAAVRSCIFSLVVLDAGACLAVQEVGWSVVILLLLVPTMTLGRWIYST